MTNIPGLAFTYKKEKRGLSEQQKKNVSAKLHNALLTSVYDKNGAIEDALLAVLIALLGQLGAESDIYVWDKARGIKILLPLYENTSYRSIVDRIIEAAVDEEPSDTVEEQHVHLVISNRNKILSENKQFFDEEAFPCFSIEDSDASSTFGVSSKQPFVDGPDASTFISLYFSLAQALVKYPNTPINNLLVDNTEDSKTSNVVVSKGPVTTVPSSSLLENVRKFAETNPQKTAISDSTRSVTYLDLEQLSNGLADILFQSGVRTGDIVAFDVTRSPCLLPIIIGIWKCGAAFLPLHSSIPDSRKIQILESAKPSLLLHNYGHEYELSYNGLALAIDDIPRLNNYDLPALSDQSLAYVLYTSGSTGTPKGVKVGHGGLASYLSFCQTEYELNITHKVPIHGSILFDLTLTSLLLPIFSGAHGVLLDEVPSALGQSIVDGQKYGITKLTPSHLRLLRQQIEPDLWANLGGLILGGEALFVEDILPFLEKNVPWVVNEYGPTETTVACAWHKYYYDSEYRVAIGSALPNFTLRLENAFGNITLPWIPGELVVRGRGVALGYMDEAQNIGCFSTEDGQLVYRTGDIAYLRDDGVLVYVGRKDDQIKWRGYRVEPSEIAFHLKSLDYVKDAIVLLCDSTSKVEKVEGVTISEDLVAFIVPSREIDIEEPQGFLKRRIPEYMVPSKYILLDSLPLSTSGKINKDALVKLLTTQDSFQLGSTEAFIGNEVLLARIFHQLLGVMPENKNDHFFRLGGHSMLAIQLCFEVKKYSDVEITLQDVFNNPTIGQLSKLVDKLESVILPGAQVSGRYTVTPSLSDNKYVHGTPMSYAQRRIWFVDQVLGSNCVFNVPMAFRLTGELDEVALEEALKDVVHYQSILRTRYQEVDGNTFQVVDDEYQGTCIRFFDWLDEKGSKEEKLSSFILNEAKRPFKLDQEYGFRASLIAKETDESVLCITFHHISLDGWSLRILFDNLLTAYNARRTLEEPEFEKLDVNYGDFSVWHNNLVLTHSIHEQLDYWKELLKDTPPMINLPKKEGGDASALEGDIVIRHIDQEFVDKLRHLSNNFNASLFVTMLSVYSILLHRYSAQDDLVVGFPIFNRHYENCEKLIGFFLNSIALRSRYQDSSSLIDFVSRIRQQVFEAHHYQDIPFDMVVDQLDIQRQVGTLPLFHGWFALHYNAPTDFVMPGVQVEEISAYKGQSQFELSLQATLTKDGMRLEFEYQTSSFEKELIENMADSFISLLQDIGLPETNDPEFLLGHIKMQNDKDAKKQLHLGEGAQFNYKESTVCQIFQQSVARYPDAIAVRSAQGQLSYRELDRRSTSLAIGLKQKGIKAGDKVALAITRSLDMIVAVIGAMKTGASYVGLDPAYPPKRTAYILSDSGATYILTEQRLKFLYDTVVESHSDLQVFLVDNVISEIQSHQDPSEEPMGIVDIVESKEDCVYITYTSGSTGEPKGIKMPNRPLVNLINWHIRSEPESAGLRTLQFASLNFDVSFWEMFSTLATGGTVEMLAEEERLDMENLVAVVESRGIERLLLTPAVLYQFTEYAIQQIDRVKSLQVIVSGSEQLVVNESIISFFEQLPSCRLRNEYGPSEAHIVTAYTYPSDTSNWSRYTPIGRPIDNVNIFVLDNFMNPVSPFVVGDIYIGGVCLSDGYINKPDVTEKVFIQNPLMSTTGDLLYKTGDLGRFLGNGNLEFLGRKDSQVKIHGYRIELAEIEVHAHAFQDISVASVIVQSLSHANEKRLILFYVSANNDLPNESYETKYREYLATNLPVHMVPAIFVRLDAFPLSPTGKVEKSKLQVPDGIGCNKALAPAQTPEEKKLLSIWCSLLEFESIGIDEEFFCLGGHSLLGIKMLAEVRKTFGVAVNVRDFLEAPTIQKLALKVAESIKNGNCSTYSIGEIKPRR